MRQTRAHRPVAAGSGGSIHTGAATFDHCSAAAAIFGSSKASISLGWMCQPRNANASDVRLEPVPEPTSSSRPVLFGRWRRAASIARSLASELIPREVERASTARARDATSAMRHDDAHEFEGVNGNTRTHRHAARRCSAGGAQRSALSLTCTVTASWRVLVSLLEVSRGSQRVSGVSGGSPKNRGAQQLVTERDCAGAAATLAAGP